MFSGRRVTISASVTPFNSTLISFLLKVIDPTVAVPLTTVTVPEVTGASKVKTAR